MTNGSLMRVRNTSEEGKKDYATIVEGAQAVPFLKRFALEPTMTFPTGEVGTLLEPEVIQSLSQESGHYHVAAWLSAFSKSLTLLTDFYSDLVEGTTGPVSPDDLRVIANSVEKMFAALNTRIKKLNNSA